MLRLITFFLLSSPALANETVSNGVSAGSYVQALLALLLIIGLLVGTLWLARKANSGKGFGQSGLKIVGGVALGPRERIVMVEAGDTWLIIGIVPGQIRTLHRMPKGEIDESQGQTAESNFAQWLKQAREKKA